MFVSKKRIRNRTDRYAVSAAQSDATSAWPRTPSPFGPRRSGIFSSAAAPMIGVASRNANRAASLFDSPTSSPPRHRRARARETRDQRERLRRADAGRIAEADRLGNPDVVVGIGLRRPAAQQLGAEEQEPVHREEERRRRRRREHASQLVLEQQAENPRGDRPDDEQPAELRVGVVLGDAAVAQAAPEPLHDPHPVLPEESEQDERRREVRRDEERDEVLVVLVDVPPEELREDHAVAEARDREELGEALQQAEHDRLPVGDGACGDQARGRALRARLEPRVRETREAEQERSDPVLDVVMVRA